MIIQVFNGLMRREDWTTAIKKPVGCLPGGSGNALSCAINYAAGLVIMIVESYVKLLVFQERRVCIGVKSFAEF